jgi:hypothetical protein
MTMAKAMLAGLASAAWAARQKNWKNHDVVLLPPSQPRKVQPLLLSFVG